MTRQQTVIIIGGPTASGKSGLALSVAQKRNGMVINADSMQIYDGLAILTAQPDAKDKSLVPHRLYGCLAPDDLCSAARFRQFALEEIQHATDMGKLPIIVGGTGFYLNTLMEGLSPIPEIPANVRARLITLQGEIGTAGLFEMLQAADPETASRIDGANTQRVIRALEVLEHTGTPLSHWQDMPREAAPEHLQFITVTLIPPREALYARCDSRFDIMLEQGAVEEALEFKSRPYAQSPLNKALGYPELCDYIDGKISLDEARIEAQQSTRRYAKRQTTWFSNQLAPDLALQSAAEEDRLLELIPSA